MPVCLIFTAALQWFEELSQNKFKNVAEQIIVFSSKLPIKAVVAGTEVLATCILRVMVFLNATPVSSLNSLN